MTLAEAFSDSARQFRDKTAVFWGEETISFARLDTESRRLAVHLGQVGRVKPGDRVAICLQNCPQFISALFGIFRAGAVAVPINHFLKPSEVAYILNDAEARILIAASEMREAIGAIKRSVPNLHVVTPEAASRASQFSEGVRDDVSPGSREDLAVIIYTSGTTGRPKGAMLTHGNLLHNVASCRHELEAVSGDRMAVVLPMFHSFMLTVGVLLPLLTGGTIVLIRSLHPVKNLIQEIIRRQATILPAIPQLFRALAKSKLPPLPIRVCVSGAAPLPMEVLKQFNQHCPIPLLEGYGLSETSPVVALNPIRGPWKPGSIGKPVRDVEVSIQDEKGIMLAEGEIGEICVRGGNVMKGYWRQPQATRSALMNNWLHTGDLGHRDHDGFFFVTDRKKDMLLVNGLNVYPREIEEVLYQIEGIKEAAVVGYADPRRGEIPVAFVVNNDGTSVSTRAVLEFTGDRLAGYKRPRRVVFLPALPRNATGKVLKTLLRERLQYQDD